MSHSVEAKAARDKRDAEIIRLRKDGLMPLAIAERMRISRNAVAGVLSRNNLVVRYSERTGPRPRKSYAERMAITRANAAARGEPVPAPVVAPQPVPVRRPKTPMPAPVWLGTVKSCCWPMWNDQERSGGERARFCSAPTEPGWQYCRTHLDIAYLTTKIRREVADAA
jgi:hypothetical protein